MRHNFNETIVSVPNPHNPQFAHSLTPESTLSPSLYSTPSLNHESVSILVHLLSYVSQEPTPSTPIIMYRIRNKPDLLHKQLQLLEHEVCTENYSSISGS